MDVTLSQGKDIQEHNAARTSLGKKMVFKKKKTKIGLISPQKNRNCLQQPLLARARMVLICARAHSVSPNVTEKTSAPSPSSAQLLLPASSPSSGSQGTELPHKGHCLAPDGEILLTRSVVVSINGVDLKSCVRVYVPFSSTHW